MKKIIIIGGGVSGLVTAILLARRSDFEVLLVDKNESFLNTLRLHLSFQEPLNNFKRKYSEIANQFHFTFLQKEINITDETILQWGKENYIDQINEKFDFLVLSTGATQISPNSIASTSQDSVVVGLNEFITEEWKDNLQKLKSSNNISFVGGGSSSIQFLFELHSYLEKFKLKPKIHFYTMEDRMLSSLPNAFHSYIHSKFKSKNTFFYPHKKIQSFTKDSISVKSLQTKESREYPSDINFLFPGVRPTPFKMNANEFGQFVHSTRLFKSIYIAGDCSFYHSGGDNSMSAQIAVRKARLVSQNIINYSQNQSLKKFNYKEIGYFISMGGLDGIGWMLFPMNVLFGPPAFVIKELIDKQFELFVKGLDTYVDF